LAEVLKQDGRYWALDKLCLCYLAAVGALIAVYWNQIPHAGGLLALHGAGVAIILLSVKLPGRVSWYVHHLYVLAFGVFCYREMALLIPAIWHTTADRWLADCDLAFWHANPTVWLERLQTPALTEFLQLIYTLFLPVVLLIPLLLWRQQRYTDFYYCAFLLTLGFLVSYAGYLIVPARGPRFFLQHLQQEPLRGLWLFNAMQGALDRLESAHFDCFPSGHTELTILAWWSSRRVSKTLSRVYLAYTLCIIFATVYLRYHYTVDLLGGVVVAGVLILAGPVMYRKLSGEDLIGSD
jgi:membrane-associated phospholipid phosphatase